MGVISVGASLGVKDDARAVAAVPSPLPARGRRSPAPPPPTARKQPLRKRPSTVSSSSSSSTSLSSSSNTTTTNSASAATQAQATAAVESDGQWQVTRVVSVATRLEPQLLLPHVIGSRGARINAIMSQAKCVIAHRRRDALASGASGSAGFFSVNFQVSAETLRRVRECF